MIRLSPLTSPPSRFTLFPGASNTLRSACPRERSGIFLSRLLFTPNLSPHAGRAAIYNTLRGNKPAVSVRLLAPGAQSARHPSKASNLLRRSLMTSPALSPSIEIVDHHPVTSSRKVAEYFGKNHRDVLRSIQTLPCSPEFNQRNFAPVEYTDAKGEKRPEYLLTKNGFVFLVMGFTGARAASLKEAYIAEFDRMEEKLRRRELSGGRVSRTPLAPDESPALPGATPIQRLILVVLARRAGPDGVCEASQQALARETGLSLRAVNRNLKNLESLGLIASEQAPGKNWKSYRLTDGEIPSLPGREDTLKSQEPGRIEGKRLGTLSPLRQELLRRAVVRKAEDSGVPPGAIWYRLMDAFRMPSHLHLAPEFFDQALLSLETRALPDGSRTKKLSDTQTGRAG